MAKPHVLVLTGYGINCDEETAYAFNKCGAESRIVHINDIIDSPGMLSDYQIFVFPGGFSYGDDTGAGKALANKIKNNLVDEFKTFIRRDTLMLGICNGFQVMVNLGIIPALKGLLNKAEVSLEYNRNFRYECRWVDLQITDSSSVFTKGISRLHIPVAHGEGNFLKLASFDKVEKNARSVHRVVDGSHGPILYILLAMGQARRCSFPPGKGSNV